MIFESKTKQKDKSIVKKSLFYLDPSHFDTMMI